LMASGIAIWKPETTSLDPLAPWIFHCALAATAVPLLLGHMFMATVNPNTRVGLSGMISGWVSREWAEHHYARWYREQFPHLLAASAQQHGSQAATTPASLDAHALPHAIEGTFQPAGEVTAAVDEGAGDDEVMSFVEGAPVLHAYLVAAADSSREALAS